MIGTHSGMTRTVERHTLYHQVHTHLVDASTAILLALHYAPRPPLVLGKEIKSQRVLALGNSRHQTVNLAVLERHHRQQRTEELLLHNGVFNPDGIQYCRGIAAAVAVPMPAKDNAVPVLFSQRGTFVVSRKRYQFRVITVLLSHLPYLLGIGSLQLGKEWLSHLLCHSHLVDIDANLSGIAKLEESHLACSVLQVCILTDHAPVARLAPKFKGHGCQVLGRLCHHMLPHCGRPRVENLVKPLCQTNVSHIVPSVN